MPVLTWATHHRVWALGMGVTVLVAALVAGAWFFLLRSPGTQVDLRQALRLYRLDQQKDDAGNAGLPPPGVYRYRTFGGEQLSFAGIHRSFPPVSEMIVTEARCATMRWEPLEQHMEGLILCPRKEFALSITSALSYEQIAGTQTTSVVQCPADTSFVPPNPSPDEQWHATCHSAGEKMVLSGEVVGLTSVDVAGREVPAVHTRFDLFFSGSETGTNPNDYWVSSNGVILRQRETVDVSQRAGPLGSVRYTEQMGITIASMVPSR